MTTSFLESDSTTSDEEQDKEKLSNEAEQEEVLMYFGEQHLPKKNNPLTLWEANALRYPTLAKLAKSGHIHTIRTFSAACNIVSKKRASLSPEHVDMLTFLHCNYMLLMSCTHKSRETVCKTLVPSPGPQPSISVET